MRHFSSLGLLVFTILAAPLSAAPKKPKIIPIPKDLSGHENMVYRKVGDKELKLDLYRLPDDKVRPGVVLIHGGGWIGGHKEALRQLGHEIAREGYVVITISYRLATEAKFPGAVVDCKQAIRWFRAHAEKYKVDPRKIYGFGTSAGGHLTAMIATTAGKYDEGEYLDYPSTLEAAAVQGSGVDQVKRWQESKQPVKNCILFFGGTLEEVPEMFKEGSPITHVSEKTAPMLFIDGEFDNPGKRYTEIMPKLKKAGVKHRFVMVPGPGHSNWRKNDEWRNAFKVEILKFFSEVK